MKKEKNVVEIPLFVPIIIIIAIVLATGFLGTKLIMTAAKYISSNVATSADGNYEYEELEDGTIEITEYKGVAEDVTIPSTINGKTVTSIGSKAFSFTEVENVILSNNITNIADKAFYCCNLKTIRLSNQLKTIGAFAFDSSFNLTDIEIPATVNYIGEGAFNFCSIKEIKVNQANQAYVSLEGVLYNKEKTELICYPDDKEGTIYTIVNGVNKIGAYAFMANSCLQKVNIPETVKEIGESAFAYCYLTEISLPNGITTLGEEAFYFCDCLTTVEIPQSVTSIEYAVFANCSNLNNIKISESVTAIKERAFEACSALEKIEIPKNVTNIEDDIFEGCSELKQIIVSPYNTEFTSENGVLFNKEQTKLIYYPEGKKEEIYTVPTKVVEIGDSAFKNGQSLKIIELHDGITNIGKWAFENCNKLTNIELPQGITTINDYTFRKCESLKNLKIPSGVTTIGWSAFYGCKNITNIELPEGIINIKSGAFYGCVNLQDIVIPESLTELWGAFQKAEIKRVLQEPTKEIELPDIIKRAMDPNDAFYSEESVELNECTLSEDNTKLIMDTNANNSTLYIKSGYLEGLTVRLVKSGTITYYQEYEWTDEIIATLHLAEGEKVTNNNGSNEYIFTKNGQFVFEYIDINGNTKKVTAKVDSFKEDLSNIMYIEIETQPNKTKYNPHESFDTTGMKVIVKYIDGTQEETTNYIVTNGEDLTCQTSKVGIQYSNSTNIYTEVPIMVPHDLQEATCTEGAACKIEGCYYIEDALGHNFKNYVSNNDATCTKEETKTAKCSRCEETDTIEEVGTKKAHIYENGKCTTCGQAEPLIKITSEKYKIDDMYISNIQPKTTVQALKNQFQTNATEVKVYNKDLQLQEDTSAIGTGMKVEFKLGDEIQTLTIIVRGDTEGDGKASFNDLLAMNSHRLGRKLLVAEYLLSADVNDNGKIDFDDMVKINQFRLERIKEL